MSDFDKKIVCKGRAVYSIARGLVGATQTPAGVLEAADELRKLANNLIIIATSEGRNIRTSRRQLSK